MDSHNRQYHWDDIYARKGERAVSWFQDDPALSLDLIAAAGATAASTIIDVGGGHSRLVDGLLARGISAVTVLDLSDTALSTAMARLGEQASQVRWIVADVTAWTPDQTYDIWHDRAAFHFLIEEQDRTAYVARLSQALKPNGHAIIATFALDGPEHCSGLPVARYDATSLGRTLGDRFRLVESRPHVHATPGGATQSFQFSVFRRTTGS